MQNLNIVDSDATLQAKLKAFVEFKKFEQAMFGGEKEDKPTMQDMFDQYQLMDKSSKENVQPESQNKPKKEVKFDDSNMKSHVDKNKSSENMVKAERK